LKKKKKNEHKKKNKKANATEHPKQRCHTKEEEEKTGMTNERAVHLSRRGEANLKTPSWGGIGLKQASTAAYSYWGHRNYILRRKVLDQKGRGEGKKRADRNGWVLYGGGGRKGWFITRVEGKPDRPSYCF